MTGEDSSKTMMFEPPLPFSKCDAINSVGFGLLDKVYLQFKSPFWRKPLGLEGDEYLFGNASGLHPHQYMFFDVGKCLGTGEEAPAILMSLISGKEAVQCERMTKEALVAQTLETLRELLSPLEIPEPIAVNITQWGVDRFSRGSYTFLPPGTTDEDFQILQSPINGNGDSLLLEGSETMRLFFAGEHTTALHPSMAHGAMLSGYRAAKEILETINFNFNREKSGERRIPLALFRLENPGTALQCSMCNKVGSRVREGALLAFKRGARQILVHNNCAEFSPEVEVIEGNWKNVIKAVNRAKTINCALCKQPGATIGCTSETCFHCFHYSCCEDTGWRFDRDGKVFYCDLHRGHLRDPLETPKECDRISLKFYAARANTNIFRCFLCEGPDQHPTGGELLAFQRGSQRVLTHKECAQQTTLVDTSEVPGSRMGNEFRNIFEAIAKSKICMGCGRRGATIRCSDPSCALYFHLPCAAESGWNPKKRGSRFRCEMHRENNDQSKPKETIKNEGPTPTAAPPGLFQHALFARTSNAPRVELPSNSSIGSTFVNSNVKDMEAAFDGGESSDSDDTMMMEVKDASSIILTVEGLEDTRKETHESTVVRLDRQNRRQPWNVSLVANEAPNNRKHHLSFKTKGQSQNGNTNPPQNGDFITTINGQKVGNDMLTTFQKVLKYLDQEVAVTFSCLREIQKKQSLLPT